MDWLLSDTGIKTIAALGAMVAFAVGVYQYWRAQMWKRAEFIAEEMKEIKADPSVRKAMIMLDWSNRRVELHTDKEGAARWVVVTSALTTSALRIHSASSPFSGEESRIREVFDDFLDHLERLHQFVKAKLVRADEIEPYLRYWIDIIGDQNRMLNGDRVPALWLYINEYKFKGVQGLMKSFKKPITDLSPVPRPERIRAK